ncbi:hypothetical protein R1flu_023592 [Riccia fluitans]|uniref:Uncharacterized protein n=1 Tax=Riccia fluitans TaxID=41844 RepID=A0ABD1XSG4_9MARC
MESGLILSLPAERRGGGERGSAINSSKHTVSKTSLVFLSGTKPHTGGPHDLWSTSSRSIGHFSSPPVERAGGRGSATVVAAGGDSTLVLSYVPVTDAGTRHWNRLPTNKSCAPRSSPSRCRSSVKHLSETGEKNEGVSISGKQQKEKNERVETD